MYTIKSVSVGVFYDGERDVALTLEEIQNPPDPIDGEEEGFHYKEFRPVRRPSIGALRGLLTPTPGRVTEDA